MVSFAVSKVEVSKTRYGSRTAVDSTADRLLRGVEDAASNVGGLVLLSETSNAFVDAVHHAFAHHLPLVLSPDDVWLCIAQGLALHINDNAEALRERFVRHQGRVSLEVERDHFVPGAAGNDWPGVFAELSDKIAQHIGKQRDLVVAGFSTTGPIERAASEVVLLAAMRSYFDYSVLTMCGIPQVTLLGTVEDWQSIRRRAEMLGEYGATTWQAALLPVLDQLVNAARGRPDIEFWRSIYKLDDNSGGPYVTGWINVLFPYLPRDSEDVETGVASTFNTHLTRWHEEGPFKGPSGGAFPSGLMEVPFHWRLLGETREMTFVGGFCGISQDPASGALRPAIGWAVAEAAPPPEPALSFGEMLE